MDNNTILLSEYWMAHTKERRQELQQALDLWYSLEDVPVTEDDRIDQDWLVFEKGDSIEDVWHWFERRFSLSVGRDLMLDNAAVLQEAIFQDVYKECMLFLGKVKNVLCPEFYVADWDLKKNKFCEIHIGSYTRGGMSKLIAHRITKFISRIAMSYEYSAVASHHEPNADYFTVTLQVAD